MTTRVHATSSHRTHPGEVSPKEGLVRSLFDAFDGRETDYCVVGDPEGLPRHMPSDIDLVVGPRDLERSRAILLDVCAASGARMVQIYQHEPTAFYYVLCGRSSGRSVFFVHVDLCSDYYRDGTRFLEANDILQDRRKTAEDETGHGGFFIPSPPAAFIYYLVKRIDKRAFGKTHGEYLRKLLEAEPAEIAERLGRLWPHDIATRLENAIQSAAWSDLQADTEMYRTALRSDRTLSIHDMLSELRRKVRRVLHPTGAWVVFLGPDGSGKSTVIEGVSAALTPAFRKTRTMHFRPSIGRRQAVNGTAVEDPHGRPPRGFMASTVKLMYYTFDYIAGYFLRTRPTLVRSTFIAFDRYYHDLLVDARRYRYGGPAWLTRLFERIVPAPDLFIVLDAPTEVLQGRKQEVPPEETERQRTAYVGLAGRLPHAHLVDASRPVAEIVADIRDVVLQHLAERTARRVGKR